MGFEKRLLPDKRLSVEGCNEFFGFVGEVRDDGSTVWRVVSPLSGVVCLELFGDGGVLLRWDWLGVSPCEGEVFGLVGELLKIEGQRGK